MTLMVMMVMVALVVEAASVEEVESEESEEVLEEEILVRNKGHFLVSTEHVQLSAETCTCSVETG